MASLAAFYEIETTQIVQRFNQYWIQTNSLLINNHGHICVSQLLEQLRPGYLLAGMMYHNSAAL